MKPKIIEQGWAGHFICADRCLFRRNTLIDFGKKKIIVSTVGAMRDPKSGKIDTIGAFGRYYETMAWEAIKDGPYWEIDVENEIDFDGKSGICADSPEHLPEDVDNQANEMHENAVKEIVSAASKKKAA